MSAYVMKTTLVWTEETYPPVKSPCILEVTHSSENGDLLISFLDRDCKESKIELDELGWHALYEMMGEVKP